MREIAVSGLSANTRCQLDLFLKSGERIAAAGEILSSRVVDALRAAGIAAVLEVPAADLATVQFTIRHREHPVRRLKPGDTLPHAIYSRQGELLLRAHLPLTEAILAKFQSRNIFDVYEEKGSDELELSRARAFAAHLKQPRGAAPASAAAPATPEPTTHEPAMPTVAMAEPDFSPADTPALSRVIRRDPALLRPAEAKRAIAARFRELEAIVLDVTAALQAQRAVDVSVVRRAAGAVLRSIFDDRELALHIGNRRSPDVERYLHGHALHTALYALHIACESGMTEKQTFEIGQAALLADIGMLKIDPALVLKPGKLALLERREVEKHVAHTVDMLQHVRGLPAIVSMAAYQVHERLDRSGYPKGRPDSFIHPYAKIIAIADTFDALCSKRPHRDAMHPYDAMELLVRIAGNKQLDAAGVRAFLQCNSLFPVGCWVELNDGSQARVIAANGEQYTRPVLRVVHDGRAMLPEPLTVDLARNERMRVIRPAPPPAEHADWMAGL